MRKVGIKDKMWYGDVWSSVVMLGAVQCSGVK